jgi:hypothetical protein
MRARITIAGVTWSVHRCRVPRTIHGDCDYSRRRIRVSSRLSGREFADTLIHELIHARWPDLSEEAVAEFASEIAGCLERFDCLAGEPDG